MAVTVSDKAYVLEDYYVRDASQYVSTLTSQQTIDDWQSLSSYLSLSSWNTHGDGSGSQYSFNQLIDFSHPIGQDITLHGQWQPLQKVPIRLDFNESLQPTDSQPTLSLYVDVPNAEVSVQIDKYDFQDGMGWILTASIPYALGNRYIAVEMDSANRKDIVSFMVKASNYGDNFISCGITYGSLSHLVEEGDAMSFSTYFDAEEYGKGKIDEHAADAYSIYDDLVGHSWCQLYKYIEVNKLHMLH